MGSGPREGCYQVCAKNSILDKTAFSRNKTAFGRAAQGLSLQAKQRSAPSKRPTGIAYWHRCLLPVAYCLLPISPVLPIACCLLPILPIACCLLPIAYCLLPIAYIACCLLPIAYCLLPKG
jgi:hypothetical protein